MDKIIDEAANRGILIMLDLHSFNVRCDIKIMFCPPRVNS
jgi:aryl-phospho-beta-D-glucosidase BglC (GH1 family)